MRYFASIILVTIFLLLGFATAMGINATFPALGVLILLPLVWYLEHTNKFTGE